jgi:hypothetical protein
MKKPVCLILICFLAEITSAQIKGGRVTAGPAFDNPSIRRSEKAEGKQLNAFQNHRRYSGEINSRSAKQLRRNREKAQESQQPQQKKGKGL